VLRPSPSGPTTSDHARGVRSHAPSRAPTPAASDDRASTALSKLGAPAPSGRRLAPPSLPRPRSTGFATRRVVDTGTPWLPRRRTSRPLPSRLRITDGTPKRASGVRATTKRATRPGREAKGLLRDRTPCRGSLNRVGGRCRDGSARCHPHRAPGRRVSARHRTPAAGQA
jgi:hypothetical protein